MERYGEIQTKRPHLPKRCGLSSNRSSNLSALGYSGSSSSVLKFVVDGGQVRGCKISGGRGACEKLNPLKSAVLLASSVLIAGRRKTLSTIRIIEVNVYVW